MHPQQTPRSRLSVALFIESKHKFETLSERLRCPFRARRQMVSALLLGQNAGSRPLRCKSMLDFLFRFRFRSPQRDRQNDQGRLTRVHEAARSSIANAESELSGLRARVEKARQSAGFLLENMDNRDGRGHQSELKSLEDRLLVGERRIKELKDHIAALQRIESAVEIELKS
jgi:hypothetical protein